VTRAELAALARLTRSLAEAVAQGELDRALMLLEERRRALAEFTWPEEAEAPFWEEVKALKALEGEVLEFCRTWRGVVRSA